MKFIILSDLHGNKAAVSAVMAWLTARLSAEKAEGVGQPGSGGMYLNMDACIPLGDLIDYGPHSNEVIEMVKKLPFPILCNLRGNHEDAILRGAYDRFSSDRGRESAQYTRCILNNASWEYLRNEMEDSGKKEFEIDGKKCLAIHGSLADEYWKSISPDADLSAFSGYDYVFSGHSHVPHFFEKYYPSDDARRRNKKKTIFINPGSVGQPRNLNPAAQFAIFDTETEQVIFEKVNYDVKLEQSFYHGQVDDFYRERLKWGV